MAAHAHEGLSELYTVLVDVVTTEAALDLESLLWSAGTLSLTPAQAESDPRYFHGIVEEATYVGFDRTYHKYRLRLRPQIHGLAYRHRTRIFQNKNAVDIIKQVFTDAGIPAAGVAWDTTGEYPVREYCTQWKESELAFVLRLLEDEGIFYWFEHTATEHVLHLGDAPDVHKPIPGNSTIAGRHHADQDEDSVWEPLLETRLAHDGMALRDWQFQTPDAPLESAVGDASLRERYEYPGFYGEQGDGDRRAQVRYEEQRARVNRLRAQADVLRFEPGRRFTLAGVHPPMLEGDWLVIELQHVFFTHERTAEGISGFGNHEMTSTSIGADVPFRPERVTPRPKAWGLESAVVTGPAGEEIHVDEFGRIKVHFYWDRENPVDDTASCWIRVQQLNTTGSMILPRLGWEMHVAFIDGDPDRPIALHKAYNQETMPPYAQPGNKTQSSMQSSTSPGGGSTNEIRMQDGNGGMEWSLHASKDLAVVVNNDENETVDVNVDESVGTTFNSLVGGDESGTVSGNQAISISTAAAFETVGSKTVSVGGNDDWGITGNFGLGTGGARTESIGGMMFVRANGVAENFAATLTRTVSSIQAIVTASALSETVAGSKTENVSAAKAVITPKAYAENIAAAKTLKSGAVLMKAGNNVTYSAKGAVALTAAGLISIKADGDVIFSGSQVRVTSGRAKFKGGGGTFSLSGSITIDASKFGGSGGPQLKLKGNINYKS